MSRCINNQRVYNRGWEDRRKKRSLHPNLKRWVDSIPGPRAPRRPLRNRVQPMEELIFQLEVRQQQKQEKRRPAPGASTASTCSARDRSNYCRSGPPGQCPGVPHESGNKHSCLPMVLNTFATCTERRRCGRHCTRSGGGHRPCLGHRPCMDMATDLGLSMSLLAWRTSS